MKKVVLLLGSNLGNPRENILLDTSKLEKRIGRVIKRSEILENSPVEFDSLNIFCNIAVIFETEYSPMQLLDTLKSIEKEIGREIDSSVYGEYRDRLIDIDIVIYDDMIYSCGKLNIPHHRHLYLREFSKKLLKEIDCL